MFAVIYRCHGLHPGPKRVPVLTVSQSIRATVPEDGHQGYTPPLAHRMGVARCTILYYRIQIQVHTHVHRVGMLKARRSNCWDDIAPPPYHQAWWKDYWDARYRKHGWRLNVSGLMACKVHRLKIQYKLGSRPIKTRTKLSNMKRIG